MTQHASQSAPSTSAQAESQSDSQPEPLGDKADIDPDHPLRDTIDRLTELSQAGEVSVEQVVGDFGGAGMAAALMIPAMLVVTPLSGIPVFSSLCGLTIALIALQMVLRRDHLWLPGFLGRRHMDGRRLCRALQKMRKVADWLDGHTAPRLRQITHAPLDTLPKVACMLAGLMMPLLELVPFSSSLLGLAVTITAIGFMARDGLYVLVAGLLVTLAACVPISVYAFGFS